MDGLIKKLKEAARDYDREVWRWDTDHRGNYHKTFDLDRADMRDLLNEAVRAIEARS